MKTKVNEEFDLFGILNNSESNGNGKVVMSLLFRWWWCGGVRGEGALLPPPPQKNCMIITKLQLHFASIQRESFVCSNGPLRSIFHAVTQSFNQ